MGKYVNSTSKENLGSSAREKINGIIADGGEVIPEPAEFMDNLVCVVDNGFFGAAADEHISAKHAVLFDAGSTFKVKADSNGLRFLLMSARPLREPIAWGGPIVMNTREELDLAFREIKEDKFIK